MVLTSAATALLAIPAALALERRIVGGEPTELGEFPYLVSMQAYGEHSCGAVLLTSTKALTAAHCVTMRIPEEVHIRAGIIAWNSTCAVTSNVTGWEIHPDYNPNLFFNDFAMLDLATPIEARGETIAYATLPQPDNDPAVGEEVTVVGWGADVRDGPMSPIQKKATIPIFDRKTCDEKYEDVDDTMFCTGHPDGGVNACNGDSGGPLINDAGEVVGLVSWSIGECADPGEASVNARVAVALPWIATHLS